MNGYAWVLLAALGAAAAASCRRTLDPGSAEGGLARRVKGEVSGSAGRNGIPGEHRAVGRGIDLAALRGGDVVLARTAFTVLLLALAWLLRADTVDYGRWLLLGVVLGHPSTLPAGRRLGRRRAGLVARLLSRAAYLGAVLVLPAGDGPWLAPVGLVGTVVLFLAVVAGTTAQAGGSQSRGAGVALGGYAVVAALLPVAAWCSGHAVVGCGATLLGAADLLAWRGRTAGGPPALRTLAQGLTDVASVVLVVGVLRV